MLAVNARAVSENSAVSRTGMPGVRVKTPIRSARAGAHHHHPCAVQLRDYPGTPEV